MTNSKSTENSSQKPLLLNPDDKAEAIAKITEISKQLQEPRRRGQHPKAHGYLRVEFTVETNLPENLKVGVFAEPGKTFPSWIRFSNARGEDDSKFGTHGMAIKLMGVEGEKILEREKDEKTQDFILIDHPVFFIRNIQDYVDFFKELEKSPTRPPLKFLIPGFNPLSWRFHEFSILLSMQRKKIVSPLETQYWSSTPYKLGSNVIKFSAKPASTNKIGRAPGSTKDYLREAMAEHLQAKEAFFDFLVQLQTNPAQMPIEDPTIAWDEKQSPWQKVATIRIPRQTFDSPEAMEAGEDLSFTPWHSLPEHQPLGEINEVRRIVYQATSERRHQERGTVPKEPTP